MGRSLRCQTEAVYTCGASLQVDVIASGMIEHSVRVPAESLYDAAVEGVAAFKPSVLAEMPSGPAT